MRQPTSAWPRNLTSIRARASDCFESGDWWIYKGDRVRNFEQEFARAHDSSFGISVCTGECAVDVAIASLGLSPGDSIVLPAFNFYSYSRSVLANRLQAIFVDVNPDNLTIDAQQVLDAVSANKVMAVVASHISGSVAQLERLHTICSEAKVPLIEGCAQATGGIYDSRRVGGWGDLAVFSFGGVKLMTCGQGGMVVTPSQSLYERVYALANRGMLPHGSLNSSGIIGQNLQLSELSAALLGPQLDVLEDLGQQRESRMNWLDRKLQSVEGLRIFKQFPKTSRRAQMTYTFFYEGDEEYSSAFILRAKMCGIPLHATYSAVTSDDRLFGKFEQFGHFPAAERGQKRAVAISHQFLLEDDEYWEELVHEMRSLI